MGDTARKDTTEHTFCVVGGVVGDGAEVPERGGERVGGDDARRQRTWRPTFLTVQGLPYYLYRCLCKVSLVRLDAQSGEEEEMMWWRWWER